MSKPLKKAVEMLERKRLAFVGNADMATEISDAVRPLRDALIEAKDHLDWIGWGDSYEREGTGRIAVAIEAALREWEDVE